MVVLTLKTKPEDLGFDATLAKWDGPVRRDVLLPRFWILTNE